MTICYLSFQPISYDINQVVDLLIIKVFSPRDAVPRGETTTATGGRRMLPDKNRVPPHRCLPAIVLWGSRGQAALHEISRVG